jgi:hypothetical protein
MNSADKIKQLKKEIEPLREKLIAHPLYQSINTIDDLHILCSTTYLPFGILCRC